MIASGPAAESFDLGAYQWKNRLFLLFAPSDADPEYRSFTKTLEKQKGALAERDVFVIKVFEQGKSRAGNRRLADSDGNALRKRFAAPHGKFTFLLIGKDGGEKYRRESGIDLQDVFRLIDSMPMRQQEMKERPQKP